MPVWMTGPAVTVFEGEIEIEPMKSDDVARYLRREPEFFEQHAELLAEIHVPHPARRPRDSALRPADRWRCARR